MEAGESPAVASVLSPAHRAPVDHWHRKLPATRLWSCQHPPSPKMSPNHLVLPWFSPSLGALDTAGGQDGEQRSNHHPPLPLSELKKVQIAELACHEINKPGEKKKQKSKEGEDSFHARELPTPTPGATCSAPVLTRGQLRHPKCAWED